MGLRVAFNLLKSEPLMSFRTTTLCAVLIPVLMTGLTAFAQTTTILPGISLTRVENNVDTYTFGAAQCNDTIGVRWTNTLLINTSQCAPAPLKLWLTSGECGDDLVQGSTDVALPEIDAFTLNSAQLGRQGTFTVKIAELPDFKNTTTADGGMLQACGTSELEKTHRVCGAVSYRVQSTFGCSGDPIVQRASPPFKLVYDSKPPGPPTITEYAAQDEAVRVGFTVDTDTSVVLLEVKGPADVDFKQIQESLASNSSIKGDGLENNVSYEVQLRARDAAGNTSVPSAPITVTPIKTLGFFGYYKDLGGTDQGCSVGVGLMPLLLTALALRRLGAKKWRKS
jgi:hypothetical protein